jgi:signal recognition particle subunit SEC65
MMSKSDELVELMRQFVQTLIDLDADKKRSDFRSYNKRNEEEFKPLMADIKKQLKEIELLFPQQNKKHF